MNKPGDKPEIHLASTNPSAPRGHSEANLHLVPKPGEEIEDVTRIDVAREIKEQDCNGKILYLTGKGIWEIKDAKNSIIYLGAGVELTIYKAPGTKIFLEQGAAIYGDFSEVYDIIPGDQEKLWPLFMAEVEKARAKTTAAEIEKGQQMAKENIEKTLES